MSDYISREAALLSLTPIVKRASERNRNIYSAVRQCVDAINFCPAADVRTVPEGGAKMTGIERLPAPEEDEAWTGLSE